MWKKKQFVTAFYHVFLNNWRSILLNSFLEIFPSVYKIRIDCAFDIFIWRAWCHINVLEKFILGYLSTVALGFTVNEYLLEFCDQRKAQEPASKKLKAVCEETTRENLVKIMLTR